MTWALTRGDDRQWTIHIDRMVANGVPYPGAHEPEWELPSHSAVITIREPGRVARDFTFVVADAKSSANAGSVDKTAECRLWARGMYTAEAAVELLARGPKPRMLHSSRPWVITSDTGNTTYVDAERLLEGTGGWSGGETLVVDVALSPRRRALQALGHLSPGHREHSARLGSPGPRLWGLRGHAEPRAGGRVRRHPVAAVNAPKPLSVKARGFGVASCGKR